jgi:broad specificity phosphatase PhoE
MRRALSSAQRVPGGRVFIARHGQRLDEADPAWLRSALRPLDPPLTDAGRAQARALGRRLRGEGVTRVFASPLLRALETAHEVAEELGLAVCVEWGLGERVKKPEQASAHLAFAAEAASLRAKLPRIDAAYRPVSAPILALETDCDAASARLVATARSLIERHASEHILLVSHMNQCIELARALVHPLDVAQNAIASKRPGECALTRLTPLGAGTYDADFVWQDKFVRAAAP